MLIFYKPINELTYQPIVVIDYTRSDETYTQKEIITKVNSNVPDKKFASIVTMEIFSLNYRVNYSHSGINLASSLKTVCTIEIDNPPNILSNLINIKQFTQQQNAISLQSAVKAIIDPQVQFPHCVIVIKGEKGFLSDDSLIYKNVIVYNTGRSYDGKRISNTLVLSCGAFSSLVIGLKTAVNIKKTLPLITQLQTSLASSKYLIKASPSLLAIFPNVEKYYAPSTLNEILSQVATDYGLFININDNEKIIDIKSLNPNDKPLHLSYKKFCFRGRVPDAKLISNFSVQDYSRVTLETEMEDVNIFDSILVYDDSDSVDYFENFIKFQIPYGKIKAYRFYVQEYTIQDDRIQTKLRMVATNNWVVSNFKLSFFLENAIYKGAF